MSHVKDNEGVRKTGDVRPESRWELNPPEMAFRVIIPFFSEFFETSVGSFIMLQKRNSEEKAR